MHDLRSAPRALVATPIVSLALGVAAIASGLGPAWRLSRLDLLPEMKSQEGAGAGVQGERDSRR